MDTDRALWDAWKGGDGAARGKLIERLMGIAHKVVRSVTARESLKDDLLSETYVGLCEAVDEWRGEGALGSLAYSRARARALNYLRATMPSIRGTVSIYQFSATEMIAEWRSDGGQEHAALISEVKAIARECMPPEEFDVVMMRMEEKTLREIARIKGSALGPTCERAARSLAKLSALKEQIN